MISRRSLLKRLGVIVATVALAPEIAFNVSRLRFGLEIDDEYACVMRLYGPDRQLVSMTYSVRCTFPDADLVIENFSDA